MSALREVLTIVLQQRKLTWEDVTKALRDPTVTELGDLTDGILEKYAVGVRNQDNIQLPSEKFMLGYLIIHNQTTEIT